MTPNCSHKHQSFCQHFNSGLDKKKCRTLFHTGFPLILTVNGSGAITALRNFPDCGKVSGNTSDLFVLILQMTARWRISRTKTICFLRNAQITNQERKAAVSIFYPNNF